MMYGSILRHHVIEVESHYVLPNMEDFIMTVSMNWKMTCNSIFFHK